MISLLIGDTFAHEENPARAWELTQTYADRAVLTSAGSTRTVPICTLEHERNGWRVCRAVEVM